MKSPWYKTTYQSSYQSCYQSLVVLHVPHDVFSTQRIDEGTILLLENLPSVSSLHEDPTILDMGCGYGALGLPVAAKFPQAKVHLVDRDLLAVHWSHENALENKLDNVITYGSLGYRDIENEQKFDWILCNVPARIGRPFIKNLIELGQTKLKPGGELRMVVIRDLGLTLLEMKDEYHWPLTEVAKGERHTIFSIGAASKGTDTPTSLSDSESLYLRDHVKVSDLNLSRPFDLGGDDPKRLQVGLPVLIDSLPRQLDEKSNFRILCFRCGYGQLPLVSRKRWPWAEVVAVDRDLLATTFTRLNAEALDLDGPKLTVRESAHFPDAIKPDEKFNLILGELSSSAGEAVALSEMQAIEEALAEGGQALLLCLEKQEKDWVRSFATKSRLSIHKVLGHAGYAVVRFSKSVIKK